MCFPTHQGRGYLITHTFSHNHTRIHTRTLDQLTNNIIYHLSYLWQYQNLVCPRSRRRVRTDECTLCRHTRMWENNKTGQREEGAEMLWLVICSLFEESSRVIWSGFVAIAAMWVTSTITEDVCLLESMCKWREGEGEREREREREQWVREEQFQIKHHYFDVMLMSINVQAVIVHITHHVHYVHAHGTCDCHKN